MFSAIIFVLNSITCMHEFLGQPVDGVVIHQWEGGVSIATNPATGTGVLRGAYSEPIQVQSLIHGIQLARHHGVDLAMPEGLADKIALQNRQYDALRSEYAGSIGVDAFQKY